MRTATILALLVGLGRVAGAQTGGIAATAPARDHGQLVVAPKVGVLLPYGFSNLGASYLVGLEVGYVLPVLKHHLAVTVDGQLTAPEASGSATDARLDAAGGSYTWHLSQREVILGATLVYRHPIGRLTPYVGVGPRLFLLDSRVTGNAGSAAIAQSSETSTKVGAGIPVGAGFRVGPGDCFAELQLNIAAIDHRTTGDTNTGSLSLAAGYRFLF
jgi:outer membrane protein with beta-barrel domain